MFGVTLFKTRENWGKTGKYPWIFFYETARHPGMVTVSMFFKQMELFRSGAQNSLPSFPSRQGQCITTPVVFESQVLTKKPNDLNWLKRPTEHTLIYGFMRQTGVKRKLSSTYSFREKLLKVGINLIRWERSQSYATHTTPLSAVAYPVDLAHEAAQIKKRASEVLPFPKLNRRPPRNSLLARRSWSQTVSSKARSDNSCKLTSE